MSLKALIVNFTFPPYPGIGGRRWAKFAKYLQRNNVDIEVIAARLLDSKTSPWLKDTVEYNNQITYVKPPYPRVMGTVPAGLLHKIKYKLALEFVKIRHGNYNYFDPSSRFGFRIKKRIESRLKKGVKNVIVSCGPFHMAAEIIELKTHYPDVNFIVDFRDPWANNRTSFGFQTIGELRLQKEKELELKVIKGYDKVLSVSQQMNDYFIQISGENPQKFSTLPNGFDKDDFNFNAEIGNIRKDALQFVFTGTLYNKVMHVMQDLVAALLKIKAEKPEMYAALKFDFYGQVPNWFSPVTAAVSDILKIHGEVELNEVYSKINESQICMLFLTDDLTYSRSTKFYEYIAAKKPIAVFSIGGETGNYLAEKGAGYACNVGQLSEGLEAIYNDWKMDNLPINPQLDIHEFDTEFLASKVMALLTP